MKSRRVTVTIDDGFDSLPEKKSVRITGRMLGAITNTEANKIMRNDDVMRRIATTETVSLEDALTGLEELCKKDSNNYGRLLVAITSIQSEVDIKAIEALKRCLYFTPPISLAAEVKVDDGLTSANLWCREDNEVIVIKEYMRIQKGAC